MNNILSKVSVLSAIGLMSSGVAFASTSQNTHTGADSSNNNTSVVTQDASNQNVNNVASILNGGSASADSGHNHSNENTGGGNISGGAANIDAALRNMVNTLQSYFSGDFGNVDWNLLNQVTGSNSDNSNNVSATQVASVNVSNSAELSNMLGLTSESGDNRADKNTGGGTVRSGNAMAGADVTNHLNFSSGVASASHFGAAMVDSTNGTTGADSTNTNTTNVTQTSATNISNVASVQNSIESSADSGDNHANKNTGGGTVSSGNATASGHVDNQINQGPSATVGGTHFAPVDVSTGNNTTGADSTNTNSAVVTQSTSTNVTNAAQVSNDLSQSADSGHNSANENTGGGSVSSGSANVSINVSNSVN